MAAPGSIAGTGFITFVTEGGGKKQGLPVALRGVWRMIWRTWGKPNVHAAVGFNLESALRSDPGALSPRFAEVAAGGPGWLPECHMLFSSCLILLVEIHAANKAHHVQAGSAWSDKRRHWRSASPFAGWRR